jgi:uncharacterized membrane protein
LAFRRRGLVIVIYFCVLALMLVELLKFIHVIFALVLISAIIYSIILTCSKKFTRSHQKHHLKILRLQRLMLITVLIAITTGSLLIYPKNFSLHTPWIRTAYVFALLFTISLLTLTWMKKKFSTTQRWAWLTIYIFMGFALLTLVHGAVTKHPFY